MPVLKPSLSAPYRKLLKNIAWLGVASVAVKPLWLFFITVLCARVLGAEGYGILNTALSLAALTIALTDLGLTQYTVREVAADRTRASRFLVNFAALRLGLAVPATAVALGIGVALGYERSLLLAVGFACVYFAAQSLKGYGYSFFQAFENLRYQALSVVVEKLLVILAGGVLLYLTVSPALTLLGMAVGMVLVTGLTLWWVTRHVAPFQPAEVDARFVGDSLRTLIPFALAGLFGMMYFRIDTIIVEALLGATAAGQYGLAFRIVEALNMLPLIVVHATLYPRLSSLFSEGAYDELRVLTRLGGGALLAASVPIALVLTLSASLLVGWIATDPELGPAGPALQVLCWVFPLICIRYLLYTALLALHEQRFIAAALGAGMVFNVVLNLVLIPSLGINGAAIATIGSEIVLLTTYAFRYRRRLRLLRGGALSPSES